MFLKKFLKEFLVTSCCYNHHNDNQDKEQHDIQCNYPRKDKERNTDDKPTPSHHAAEFQNQKDNETDYAERAERAAARKSDNCFAC